MDIVLMIVYATLILGFLVFIHEGGHYLAARAFGVRVTEFMLGLPGPNIGFTKWGTKFGVTPFLLGGYAKVCGMEPGEMSPVSYTHLDVYKRQPYIRRRAIRHMEKGRVVILAAGTGNPYFTTDTTAALRACELDVDVLMKATKVDGVYDSDPKKNPDAKRYDRVSYMEVLSKGLNVMDSTATSLCMDNDVPMIVFDLTVKGNISRALKGEDVGTTVESQ